MIPDADASAVSQAITYVVAVYAIGLIAHVGEQPGMGVAIALCLLAGIAVGLSTGASRFFKQAPGTLLGLIASIVTLIALSMSTAALDVSVGDGRVLAVVVIGVGAFVAGMDWTRVGRLRSVPVLAALPVLAISAGGGGSMLAVGLAWLALAVAALWSLEIDQRAAFSDPRPLTPTAGPRRDFEPRDLAGAVGIALLLGLLFAFSASMPSCSANLPGFGRFGYDGPRVGAPDIPFDTGRLSLDDIRFGNFPFDFDGELPSIDIGGVEHLLREGASGMLFLENTLTGERFPLRREGGNLVARDAFGNVVAVIRPMEEAPPETSSSVPWKQILGGLAVVGIAAAALWWYLKRRKPPSGSEARQWAEELVARIDRFGRAHGVPRSRSETVGHHLRDLDRDVSPDERLADVAEVVAEALFDREQPTMDRRIWAEQVIDQYVEANPPPSRIDRMRSRRRRPPEREPEEPASTIGRR